MKLHNHIKDKNLILRKDNHSQNVSEQLFLYTLGRLSFYVSSLNNYCGFLRITALFIIDLYITISLCSESISLQYLSHINTPTLVSVACGTAMFHTLTKAHSTHHVIDTLIIKSPEVNYDERENIQVIYHTAD